MREPGCVLAPGAGPALGGGVAAHERASSGLSRPCPGPSGFNTVVLLKGAPPPPPPGLAPPVSKPPPGFCRLLPGPSPVCVPSTTAAAKA